MKWYTLAEDEGCEMECTEVDDFDTQERAVKHAESLATSGYTNIRVVQLIGHITANPRYVKVQ